MLQIQLKTKRSTKHIELVTKTPPSQHPGRSFQTGLLTGQRRLHDD